MGAGPRARARRRAFGRWRRKLGPKGETCVDFPVVDVSVICGKISHVNLNQQKGGIVSHAGRGYNFAMNANSPNPKPASHQPIAAAKLHAPLARLLRPLVRLCIRSGMTFPALAQLLRELFVNVAEHDFALDGKDQTDSRVSLLTGIHRKEVARLRGAGAPVHETPATLSRTSAIIARWLAAPEFTDAKGEPLPLPRTAEGGAPSFEALVESVTKDVRPRAVLDEWLDRKLVTINGDDEIVLIDTGFVPRGDDDRKWHYLGRNLHDHVAAAADERFGGRRHASWSARCITTACRRSWRSGSRRVRASLRWRH